MKSVLIASAAFALTLSAAPAAMAANARMPYQNVDRSNDMGNDTGDASVDSLNAAQLDQNYKGPYYNVGQGGPPPTAAPVAGMAPDSAAPMRRPMHRPMRRPMRHPMPHPMPPAN